MKDAVGEYIRAAPKVELHLHLEGAIRPARFLSILRRHGIHPEMRSEADIRWLFQHSNFIEFLEHFRFVVTRFRSVEDVHEVATDLFEDLRDQNVIYAEILFSAGTFEKMGLPWNELLDAVSRAAQAASPRYNVVIDLVRNLGAEYALQQVRWLCDERPDNVVGIHLGGDERQFPARLFTAAYRLAQSEGLGLAAHAGEGDGAASVREAIEQLEVTRIGHGIRCVEDPAVVGLIRERGVTLEICPSSNLSTRVVSELSAHPLPLLLREGLAIALGSDDPAYFGTDLTREMQLAQSHLHLTLDELDQIQENALRAAFDPSIEREPLLENLRSEQKRLRADYGLPAPGSAAS